jgi:hypothetical protein
VGKVEEFS